MKIIQVLISFFIEFAKLLPIMCVVLKFKLKPFRQTAVRVAAALALSVAFGLSPVDEMLAVPAYLCIIATILILEGRGKVIYTFAVYLGISTLDMLAAVIWVSVNGTDYDALAEDKNSSMIVNSICIVTVAVLSVIFGRLRKSAEYELPKKVNYAYLVIIIIGEIALQDSITLFMATDGNNKMIVFSLSAASVIFLLTAVIMFKNYISKNHYKSICDINEKLLKSQEKYYLMLLEREEETKKFRHDIKGHINCMYLLFKNNSRAELESYFEKMGASLSEIDVKMTTGSNMVNAVLNDAVSRFPEVSVTVNGAFPQDMKLSGSDLCTIFSNLFENAFAAAARTERKYVDISIKILGSSLYVTVVNPVAKRVEIVGNCLQSEKRDKLRHGYGTVNAVTCAERNGGSLIFKCSDTVFEAELIIPNVKP